MRDFFIRSFEMLVNILVVVMSLVVVIAAVGAMMGSGPGMMGQQGGLLAGLAILVFGGINVIIVAGLMYLGLGIYQNTKQTADAVARLAQRQ